MSVNLRASNPHPEYLTSVEPESSATTSNLQQSPVGPNESQLECGIEGHPQHSTTFDSPLPRLHFASRHEREHPHLLSTETTQVGGESSCVPIAELPRPGRVHETTSIQDLGSSEVSLPRNDLDWNIVAEAEDNQDNGAFTLNDAEWVDFGAGAFENLGFNKFVDLASPP